MRTRALHFAAFFFVVVLLARAGSAATITANGTTCTLSSAILAANADTPAFGCTAGSGSDTIDLQYDVTLSEEDNVTPSIGGARAGLPEITTNITITGNGHLLQRDPSLGCSTASEGTDFRLIEVTAGGTLLLNHLTLAHGCVVGAPEARGAAVLASGSNVLTLRACTFQANVAIGSGGAPAQPSGNAYGGAVDADVLVLVQPFAGFANAFISNVARGGDDASGTQFGGLAAGGAIHIAPGGQLGISATTFTGNVAQGGSAANGGGAAAGGAINGPIVAMADVTLVGNSAYGGDSPTFAGGWAYGGGFDSGLTGDVQRVVVRNNLAQGGASGNDVGGTAIGGGALISPGMAATRTVSNSDFSDNWAIGGNSTTGRGGDATGGGAALHGAVGALAFDTTTFGGNHSQGGDARSLDVDSYTGNGTGGGVGLGLPTPTTATLANVTIYGNIAMGGHATAVGGVGGGGAGGGVYSPNSTLTIASSTVASNQANAGAGSVGDSSGGGISFGGVGLTLGNSILADNTNSGSTAGADCIQSAGTFTSAGYNWVENPNGASCTGGTGTVSGMDPGLGAFGDHHCATPVSGTTCARTVALTAGSAALDQGSSTAAVAVTVDARGFVRPQDLGPANVNDGSDPGAFELQPDQLELTVQDSVDPVLLASPTATFTDVVTLSNVGTNPSANVNTTITCTLPAGVTIDAVVKSAPGSLGCNGTNTVCNWTLDAGPLAVGASVTLTYYFTVQPNTAAGSVVDCIAGVTSATPTPPPPVDLPGEREKTLIVASGLFSDGYEGGIVGVWSARSP